MRFTPVLNRQFPHRLFRQLWQNRKTVKKVVDWGVPQALIDKGIPVYDGLKFSKEREPVDLAKFLPPSPQLARHEWAYLVAQDSRLLEGPLQAQILTNSLASNKLPQEYQQAFAETSVSEEETSWLSERLEVIKHDSAQFKLPQKIDPERPWHRFPRDFGAGIGRETNEITAAINDFVRLPLASPQKTAAAKPLLHELWCQFLRPAASAPGSRAHVFQGFSAAATVGRAPLPPLAASGGASSCTGPLPSMYPALPEMDLKKVTDYEPRTLYPSLGDSDAAVAGVAAPLSLHTLFVTHPWLDEWPAPEKLGRTILQAYTFAAARAAAANLAQASAPLADAQRVRLHAVFHDLHTLAFVVFQLNTLSAPPLTDHPDSNDDAVRNQVWYEWASIRQGPHGELNPNALRWLKVFHQR